MGVVDCCEPVCEGARKVLSCLMGGCFSPPPPFSNSVSFCGRVNSPWLGLHSKYWTPATHPLFFPSGTSRTTPTHIPRANSVSPKKAMTPGLVPSTNTWSPTLKLLVVPAVRGGRCSVEFTWGFEAAPASDAFDTSRSFSGRAKRPRLGSHSKYWTPFTSPLFFPSNASRMIPAHVPLANCVGPRKAITPGFSPFTKTRSPTSSGADGGVACSTDFKTGCWLVDLSGGAARPAPPASAGCLTCPTSFFWELVLAWMGSWLPPPLPLPVGVCCSPADLPPGLTSPALPRGFNPLLTGTGRPSLEPAGALSREAISAGQCAKTLLLQRRPIQVVSGCRISWSSCRTG